MSEQTNKPGHPVTGPADDRPGAKAGASVKDPETPTMPETPETPETPEITLDEPTSDIEAAMRDALSAVEAMEADTPQDAQASPAGSAAKADEQEEEEEEDVQALRREIADLRDRSMRTLADFDNFRKRAERERQEIRRYALLEPLREFLPVADNLERALQADGPAEDLKRGVEMILRQMRELLRRFGVREVPSDGEVFNPMMHEAVARTESDQLTVPTVTETLVRGYMLHDRLLRPAMVKVAVPPEGPGAKPGPGTSSGASGAPGAPGDDNAGSRAD
ncbi:MAG: nucleotide exchange factor GrpE [Acidobacteria bacterium]|nr:nucleotide exchange factor GrpE [Acidobacteriota bacterium]